MRRTDRVELFFTRLATFANDPDRPVALSADRDYSYSELLEEVARWSGVIASYDCVAYQLPNGADWITLDLALLKTGKVGVPIPEFFTAAQRSHVLACSGADLLIAAEPLAGGWAIPETSATGARLYAQNHLANSASLLWPDTAKVTFTSGTTGAPKGVCLGANTLIETAQALTQTLAPQKLTRHLSVLPLSLLLENVAGVYANLCNGGTLIVPQLEQLGMSGSSSMDPLRFAQAQVEYAPHSLIIVPQQLLALTALAEAGVALPTSYRFIAVGGARVSPDLLDRAHAQGLPVYEGYGLTECGSVVALNTPAASVTGSAGQLLPHVNLSVEGGEVVVVAPRMLGYAGCTDAPTQIYTGDTGQLQNGQLFLEGRKCNRIITSFGRNLAPEWVESELQAETAVGLAVVFGNDMPTNVALIAPRDGVSEADLRCALANCNSRLPDYARVGAYLLVERAELVDRDCLSPLGKLRRLVCEQHYGERLRALVLQPTDRLADQNSQPLRAFSS